MIDGRFDQHFLEIYAGRTQPEAAAKPWTAYRALCLAVIATLLGGMLALALLA